MRRARAVRAAEIRAFGLAPGMLRDRGDMPSVELPGRRSPRRLGRVVLAIGSWLLTVAAAGFGLWIAWRLWIDYAAKEDCPAPAAPPTAVAPPPAPPPPYCQPARAIPIKLVSVREDAVEINANGDRFDLPGYPPPSAPGHEPATLTTAVVSPDGEQVAIAGICHGGSDRPSCARKFVRIYQALDGAHLRDLKTPWVKDTDDERRVLAMAYNEASDRLAVLVRIVTSDCMWIHASVELTVYWVADGTPLMRRVLEKDDKGGKRQLTVVGDEIRVFTTRPQGKQKVRVVPLPWPDFIADCDGM